MQGEDFVPDVKFAEKMREHSTPAERGMWEIVNSEAFRGFKFRRQHLNVYEGRPRLRY